MSSLTWKPYRKSLAPDITRLWNRALGDHFPMTEHLLRQNTEGAPSYHPDDSTVVLHDGTVVGYVLTKRFREQDPLLDSVGATGWVEAIVVDPQMQRQGLGRDLMAWAIYRLRSNGAQKIYVGSGYRHFFPGVPAELPGLPEFFAKNGFKGSAQVHDLKGDLRGFKAPQRALADTSAAAAVVRPCRPDDVAGLMAFLRAEFPGRWRFDTKRYLDLGGNPDNIMILCQGERVIGFAHVYFRGGSYQGPPTYWHSLVGAHYGGLGPIGVAASVRGKGLGLALLQLSLEHLATLGVEDAVIDWTTLLDFYARAGFAPWKTYIRMEQ